MTGTRTTVLCTVAASLLSLLRVLLVAVLCFDQQNAGSTSAAEDLSATQEHKVGQLPRARSLLLRETCWQAQHLLAIDDNDLNYIA